MGSCRYMNCSSRVTKKKKMARTTLRPGIGCEFSCRLKYVYPKRTISRRYPNYNKRDDKLEGAILIREGHGRCSGKQRDVYFFTHIDLPEIELYVCKSFIKVTMEGPESGLFIDGTSAETDPQPEQVDVPMETNDIGQNVG